MHQEYKFVFITHFFKSGAAMLSRCIWFSVIGARLSRCIWFSVIGARLSCCIVFGSVLEEPR